MIKNCVFHKPNISNDIISNTFNLKKILSNNRTTIYQNDEMRLSIDSNIVRVILFDNNNQYLIEKLRNYFYGEEYERM